MYNIEIHIGILGAIMIAAGALGGYINYLHKFDTTYNEPNNGNSVFKYNLLGIGSAVLVPTFLKLISSDLIRFVDSTSYDKINYLVFSGFCLVAAIFSKRFITTIGDSILEAAKNAEKMSKEAKKEIESTKLELTTAQNSIESTKQELTTAQERIEDVKTAVNLKNSDTVSDLLTGDQAKLSLLELVESYLQKTTIPDYPERLTMKAELGRKMGQIIIRHNLSKVELLEKYPQEGLYLALAYSIELKPDFNDATILNSLSKLATQLYTKYVILRAYRTLESTGLINEQQANEAIDLIEKFRAKADKPLQKSIDDTIRVLRIMESKI